jgi:hypothetical protein
MLRKSRTRFTYSVRIARSEQPTSVTDSFVTQLRALFAIRDDTSRTHESRRFWRTPFTTSAPSASIFAMSLGMSAGSFCRSASSVTVISPRTASKPAANAAVWPWLPSSTTTRTRGSFSAISRSTARLRSFEPSSTKTISAPPATLASAASSSRCSVTSDASSL